MRLTQRYLRIIPLLLLAMVVMIACASSRAMGSKSIIVATDGSGDFRSIQAAINSLADSAASPRIIFIKKGTYDEKLFITKHNIVLQGEDRAATIITQSIARDAFRCNNADDWGVATMNINGNDITLVNLTVVNDYGFRNMQSVTIDCNTDSTGKKVIARNGHQMALRTITATRLKAVNCHFKAFGGDTVSPWNVEDGMFYFRDCTMEGGVDFYCPRGWAYAENCHFISHTGSAAIWHDGSKHEDSKTVLVNCTFAGFDGFNLGRYHRDAHFYLVNCSFPANMSEKDIYLVPTQNTILWGRRVYYYNCHKAGGDLAWHKDNLTEAPGSPKAETINPQWVFKGRWSPELKSKY